MFFYQLGRDMNEKGMPLQLWAHRLGHRAQNGHRPAGREPGPPSRRRSGATRLFNQKPKLTDRPWSVGDNINLSVGQGDLQANPLQMAVAYAAIANGGRVLRPRLGLRIEDATGRALQQLDAPTARRVKISSETAQRDPRGPPRRGERAGRHLDPGVPGLPDPDRRQDRHRRAASASADQSWYVALAPYPNPRYVVAVTDEAGGFGADTAAPMTRRILAALFDVKENGLVQGGGAPD